MPGHAVRLLVIIAAPNGGPRLETDLERLQRDAAMACLERIHAMCPDVVADSRPRN